jgi:hypothetical protein
MSNINESLTRWNKSEPFELQVARGQIRGHSVVNIFGFNSSVGTNFITPWELNTQYPFLSAAHNLTLVSTSASDLNRIVIIQGLDINYNAISESIVIGGLTPVTTTKEFFRINSMTAGDGAIVGNITASYNGVVYAQITDGVGRTQMAQFTVPAGHSFYLYRINGWSATATGNQYITFRNRVTTLTSSFDVAQATFTTSPFEVQRRIPFAYGEKTTIQFQCKSSSSTNNIALAGEGILIKNQD